MKQLMIVVPAYNEEEALPKTLEVLDGVLSEMINQGQVTPNSQILIVNDGSADKTWDIVVAASQANPHITGINFSRNYGHQNALIAGLTVAQDAADIFITIDADLQDDVNAIPEMVAQNAAGYDIVYGARNSRETDSAFKRNTAELFYKIMGKLGVEMVPDSADYRLMSRRAVIHLLDFKEHNLFLRGIVPRVGFPSTVVYYARKEREAGESKYPLSKMINFAWDGITSFSVAPMRFILGIGVLSVLFAIIMVIYAFIKEITGHTVAGWSSLMISLWVIGGLQLIAIAILGEYIGKIFNEVKDRPRYVIQDNLLNNEDLDDKQFTRH
ncbi:glycosyltransferase involved in cell wall biosynthesis [Weissella uvarum]|uniref:glycosyltransferase family 2 protein n=1 Tax=Weissella uvarum TaxID=1479233 RepID=UPI00196066E6|nr:glycosyltransferase family 2 protein [Weissella uvarum]MBM7617434.1 glycosyltransferase involved in cell wall biosynthesis [Weissella uvarum]MCM0595681.1 glycosyltransferase family 2 protein [Weissella uvarum]